MNFCKLLLPTLAVATIALTASSVYTAKAACTYTEDTTHRPPEDYTLVRNKPSSSYSHKCVVDELGYIHEDVNLKFFYDKTGIQPYIAICNEDITAEEWYKKNLLSKDAIAIVYSAARGRFDVAYGSKITAQGRMLKPAIMEEFYTRSSYDFEDIFYSVLAKFIIS